MYPYSLHVRCICCCESVAIPGVTLSVYVHQILKLKKIFFQRKIRTINQLEGVPQRFIVYFFVLQVFVKLVYIYLRNKDAQRMEIYSLCNYVMFR